MIYPDESDKNIDLLTEIKNNLTDIIKKDEHKIFTEHKDGWDQTQKADNLAALMSKKKKCDDHVETDK